MAFAANTKSWDHDVNNALPTTSTVITDSQTFWLTFKDILLGFSSAPWTVSHSCDGTTAGTTGDGVDRWADPTDIVFGANTAATRSWMVLESANGAQLLIDCVSATTTSGRAIRLSYVSADNAAVNPFEDGTTTEAPTSSDEVQVLSGAASNTWGAGPHSDTSNLRDFVLHVMQSTDGQVLMGCVCVANQATAVFYFGTVERPSYAGAEVAMWFASDDNGDNNMGWDLLFRQLTANVGVHRSYGVNLPTNGSAEVWLVAPSVCVNNSVSGDTPYGETRNSNVSATNTDTSEDECPRIGVYCNVAGDRGTKGRLYDLRWGPGHLGNTDTQFPLAGTRTHAKLGQWVFPWDGSAVTTA